MKKSIPEGSYCLPLDTFPKGFLDYDKFMNIRVTFGGGMGGATMRYVFVHEVVMNDDKMLTFYGFCLPMEHSQSKYVYAINKAKKVLIRFEVTYWDSEKVALLRAICVNEDFNKAKEMVKGMAGGGMGAVIEIPLEKIETTMGWMIVTPVE
jgi:hypothetical protein